MSNSAVWRHVLTSSYRDERLTSLIAVEVPQKGHVEQKTWSCDNCKNCLCAGHPCHQENERATLQDERIMIRTLQVKAVELARELNAAGGKESGLVP